MIAFLSKLLEQYPHFLKRHLSIKIANYMLIERIVAMIVFGCKSAQKPNFFVNKF